MKISLIVTALILAGFAFFGWREHQQLAALKARVEERKLEAESLGLTDRSEESLKLSSRLADRGNAASMREAKAREAARKLMAVGNDYSGGDPARQAEYLEGLSEIGNLDLYGLKIVIAEIQSNKELVKAASGNLMLKACQAAMEIHPEAVLALLKESPELASAMGPVSSVVAAMALDKLGRDHPEETLTWIRKNAQDHPELVNSLSKAAAVKAAAGSDPALAFSLIEELGLAKDGQALNEIGAAAKTPEARDAFLAALRQYTARTDDPQSRLAADKTAFAAMASHLTKDGFETSAGWLKSANLSVEETSALAGSVERWTGGRDPGEWIEWVSDKLPEDQLPEKVEKMMSSWTARDYRAAGTWLAHAPEGPTKDFAVRSYAETVAATDPQVASQWAETLPADPDRAALMGRIYNEWKKRDEAAAEKFAEAKGLK